MTLESRAGSVRTIEDFVAFLAMLRSDYAVNGERWENGKLPEFLEAMAAWSEDMEGYYANKGLDISQVSPWRVMADILAAARIYE